MEVYIYIIIGIVLLVLFLMLFLKPKDKNKDDKASEAFINAIAELDNRDLEFIDCPDIANYEKKLNIIATNFKDEINKSKQAKNMIDIHRSLIAGGRTSLNCP